MRIFDSMLDYIGNRYGIQLVREPEKIVDELNSKYKLKAIIVFKALTIPPNYSEIRESFRQDMEDKEFRLAEDGEQRLAFIFHEKKTFSIDEAIRNLNSKNGGN